MDRSRRVAWTDFDVGWILEQLQRHNERFALFVSEHGEPTACSTHSISEGSGHISEVFRVVFTFPTTPSSFSVVLKVPTTQVFEQQCSLLPDGWSDEQAIRVTRNIRRMHSTECDFFAKMAHHFSIPVPQVFFTAPWTDSQQGCVLMEDLSAGVVLSKFQSVNERQTEMIVKFLADFHCEFLKMDASLWQGRFEREVTGSMATKFDKAVKNVLLVCNPDAHDRLSRNLDAMRPLAKSVSFFKWVATSGYRELGLPTVLTHGDFWNGNIVWTSDANGEASDTLLGLLDWQVVGIGSPLDDLNTFLMQNCDPVDRRLLEEVVFDVYLDRCRRKAPSNKFLSSVGQLKLAYQLEFVPNAVCALVVMNKTLFSLKDEIEKASNEEKLAKQALFDKCFHKLVNIIDDAANLVQTSLSEFVSRFPAEEKQELPN